jgi:hypothetical protein
VEIVEHDIGTGVALVEREEQLGTASRPRFAAVRGAMTTTEAKVGAAGGIAYGAISLIAWGFWALPWFPQMHESAHTWVAWYVHYDSQKRLAGSLWALSVIPMAFFISTLYTALRQAEGGRGYFSRVMLIGGVLTEVSVVLFSLALLVATYRPGKITPDITYTMNDIFILVAVPLGVGFLIMTLSTAAVVLKYGGLPRWVGKAALLVGVLQLGFQPSSWVTTGTFDGSGGLLGLYLPYGGSLAWFIATGFAIVRMTRTHETRRRAEVALD